jgi:flavorubredoxin
VKEVNMAVSGKYGKISIPKVGADEPVFVLRAQDKLAETAIEMYRALAASHGRPLANSLQKEIEAFKKWPTKKMPD